MTFTHDCSHRKVERPDGSVPPTDRALCWFELNERAVAEEVYDDNMSYGQVWNTMDMTAFLPRNRALHIVV